MIQEVKRVQVNGKDGLFTVTYEWSRYREFEKMPKSVKEFIESSESEITEIKNVGVRTIFTYVRKKINIEALKKEKENLLKRLAEIEKLLNQ